VPRAVLGRERRRDAGGAAGADPGRRRLPALGQRQPRGGALAAARGRQAAARPPPARTRSRRFRADGRGARGAGRRRRARGAARFPAVESQASTHACTEALMDLGLTDKVALVTGASKGLGEAVPPTRAAEGARVAVVARDAGSLDKVAAESRDRSKRDAVAIAADLSRLEETERVVRETKERLGRIDILVNNAG